MVAASRPLAGGQVALSYSPHSRLWSEVSVQHGSSWQMCADCGATAAELKLRGTLVRHSAFNLTPWAMGSATSGAAEWTVGIAAEGGTDRLRFDTSWPLQSSNEKLVTLRIMPETGVSWAWSDSQATRFAVVGLEPSYAMQHRSRFDTWTLVSTLRLAEEGLGAEVGVQWAL